MKVRNWSVDPAAESLGNGAYLLRAHAHIERPLGEVFDFFADATNLERITPPSLEFSIVTPAPIEMRTGTQIDYRLKLNGIPFRWRTEITEWNPPPEADNQRENASFTDVQIKGPYHTWVHKHQFAAIVDEYAGTSFTTHMIDEVQYRLPLWPFGAPALPLVKRELRRIFVHRMRALSEAFP